MKNFGSIGLALALALAGIASACGPATPEGTTPPTPTGEPTATPAPTATEAPTAASTAPAPTAEPTGTATTPPAAPEPVGPAVKASAFAEDLKKAGFDLAKLPAKIGKMNDGQKKKIMPLFVKALGYENCQGCHAEGDFKKKTRNLEIAEHMYDEFVAGLRDEKNVANVFCDSCHQGKPKILNRSDLAAVNKYMQAQYVDHFERADKKSHECSTCHGETFEMKIFDKLWKVAAK